MFSGDPWPRNICIKCAHNLKLNCAAGRLSFYLCYHPLVVFGPDNEHSCVTLLGQSLLSFFNELGGAEEDFEMNLFFPGNPFRIIFFSSARPLKIYFFLGEAFQNFFLERASQNFFFPGECLSKFIFFLEIASRNYFFLDFLQPHPRSLMVVPIS